MRGGFEDRERTIEILTEEMYEPGELDAAEVEHAVDAAMRAHDQAKKGWPARAWWRCRTRATRKAMAMGT